MTLTEISLSLGHTIGRPGYSSLRVDASRTARLTEGDDTETVREELRKLLLEDLTGLIKDGLEQV